MACSSASIAARKGGPYRDPKKGVHHTRSPRRMPFEGSLVIENHCRWDANPWGQSLWGEMISVVLPRGR